MRVFGCVLALSAAAAACSLLPDGVPSAGTGGGGSDGSAGGLVCAPDQKVCDGACAYLDNPLVGCDATSCEPCAFANAGATCLAGSCTRGACNPGSGDCDGDATNGCEATEPTASSCQCAGPGAGNDCGPSGDDDCCTSLDVMSGTFPMGRGTTTDAAAGQADELPEHPTTIGDFKLDRFEVSVGRFRRFVNTGTSTQDTPPVAGSGAALNVPGDQGWQISWIPNLEPSVLSLKNALGSCNENEMWAMWSDSVGTDDSRPINCVTWYEAVAFCAWDGGWLPTEAEWEYAAAGGALDRLYPWDSASPTIDHAVHHCEFALPAIECTSSDIAPVGHATLGDGSFGHSDMAGSMSEWTLDWFDNYAAGPCDNCASLTRGTVRVARGGWFGTMTADGLRAADRESLPPTSRDFGTGFRCARAM